MLRCNMINQILYQTVYLLPYGHSNTSHGLDNWSISKFQVYLHYSTFIECTKKKIYVLSQLYLVNKKRAAGEV